jgi:hypothetical protein
MKNILIMTYCYLNLAVRNILHNAKLREKALYQMKNTAEYCNLYNLDTAR